MSYNFNQKRYNPYSDDLKQRFSCKIARVSLNAGFTCPNIDGSKGIGGCSYCSALGSGDFAENPELALYEQFQLGKKQTQGKWPNAKYIAYFQSRSNTYAPLSKIKSMLEQALLWPELVGISVATRADCITEEIADYFEELNRKTFLNVELGLQSIHEKTAERINRCHSTDEFLNGYFLLKNKNIRVTVHLINGLPGETREMMVQSAREVSSLLPYGVKIHMLHLLKGTRLAEEYEKSPFTLLSKENYISVVCDQLEQLNESIVIQRLTGDGDKRQLLAPLWTQQKRAVLNGIDQELRRRDSWQGKKCKMNKASLFLQY